MSFLREILASAEEIEMHKLKLRVPELKSEVHICKAEILKTLDEMYVEYLQKPAEIPHHSERLRSLQDELSQIKLSLQHGIKKEPVCEDVVNNLNEYVQEMNIILLEMKELYCIHAKIIDMNLHYSNRCYSESLRLLKEVESIMKSTQSSIIPKYFQKTKTLQKGSMFRDFDELINTAFSFSLIEQGNTSSLKYTNNVEVNDLVQQLYIYNNHISLLNKLIDFLWDFVFVPIFTCIVKVTVNESALTVVVIKRNSKLNYSEIFKKLYKVNYFLQSCLNLILCQSDNVTLLEYIGDQLKDKFSPLLITHCLQKICPPDEGDQLDYNKIIEDTKNLLNELKFLKIISDGSILEYARNMKEFHNNKRCDKFLNHAKTLMDQKNTEITQIGTPLTNNDVNNVSDFPSISISSIAQELLQMIESILMEMKGSPTANRSRLFQTVLGILDYYMINGTRYQDEMKAQEVALFHNNCKYIAHELEEWNSFYSDIFQNDVNIPLFKNEAFQFQTIADETLNNYLSIETNKLRSWLSRINLESVERPEELPEKPIRICFVQLRYLKDAWCNILSNFVYNKSMGVLFNILCEYFVKFILKFQRFEKNIRQKLSETFNFIIKNAPSYFSKSDLKTFIFCWEKFKSISFILNSNLVEIDTNWCCRRSFLRSNLKTDEMRFLIKSLFEDSQKTKTILSRIHD